MTKARIQGATFRQLTADMTYPGSDASTTSHFVVEKIPQVEMDAVD